MEINIFGRKLSLGFSHRKKETLPAIIPFMNLLPKQSVPKLDERALRNFARKSIPHRAITLVRDGVLAQKWQIVPAKEGDKNPYKKQIKAIKEVIESPNDADNYRSFWGAIINETLIGDNGAAEIVDTNNPRKPLKLYPVNGFTLEAVTGFFVDSNCPRFCQKLNQTEPVYLKNEDVLYIQHNKTLGSPFGLSPLEAAFGELNALFDAEDYAGRQASNAFPKFALNMGENVSDQDLLAVRKYFVEEVFGQGTTAIFGGTRGAEAVKIGAGGDSELYLEWQRHLITVIALSFGIDPKKLGQGSNTDRSTVEEQNESMLNEAIRPMCLLLQDEINRKIIARMGFGDILKFEFTFEDTLAQKQTKQQMTVDLWNTNAITLREYREALGKLPMGSAYDDMTQAEMKACMNKEYAINTGGYNGLGKNQKEDVEKKTNGEKEQAKA